MPVLTVASSKGGAGKTTVCMLVGGSLAGELRVTAIDADPGGALSRWAARAYEGPPFETLTETDEARLAHLIAAKADVVDLLSVDTAGFGNRAASVAMTSADAVLVPCLSGEADITEAERTIGLAEGLARAARRAIPARVLLNRLKRTVLARHAAGQLNVSALSRLTTSLSDLVAYGELTYSGQVPVSGPAAAEIRALIEELRTLGWVPSQPHHVP